MTDIRHFTTEEIEERLREALEITDRLEPAADLRPHVFNVAASRLMEKTVIQGAPALLPMGGQFQ